MAVVDLLENKVLEVGRGGGRAAAEVRRCASTASTAARPREDLKPLDIVQPEGVVVHARRSSAAAGRSGRCASRCTRARGWCSTRSAIGTMRERTGWRGRGIRRTGRNLGAAAVDLPSGVAGGDGGAPTAIRARSRSTSRTPSIQRRGRRAGSADQLARIGLRLPGRDRRTWTGHVTDERGGAPDDCKNAVCIHEEDFGVLWKHTYAEPGARACRSRGCAARAGWSFRRSPRWATTTTASTGISTRTARWEHEIKATGIVQTIAMADDDPQITRHKHRARTWRGTIHQHFFCFRLDMEVGPARRNSVYEVDTVPLPRSAEYPRWATPSRRRRTLLGRASRRAARVGATRRRRGTGGIANGRGRANPLGQAGRPTR